jgi:hypothetical protein
MSGGEVDLQALVQRLVRDFEYVPGHARSVAKRLQAAAPPVRAAFLEWWTTGRISDLTIEGYSIDKLMKERRMNPVAALLLLDWLAREPERAKAGLVARVDRIRFKPPEAG